MTALLQQIGLALGLIAPEGETWAGIGVRVDVCVREHAIDRGQLAYLVANELEGAPVATRLRESRATFDVLCEGDRVIARVGGAAPAETIVDTRGLERSVATRTLALAIVEMVTELPEPVAPPIEPEPEPDPNVVTPTKPAPPAATKPPEVPRRTRWIVRGGVDAIGFPLAPLGLFSAAFDVRHRPSRRIGWLAAIAAGGGRDRATLGVVRAVAASAAVAFVVHGARERLDPYAALGARGGVLALRGIASSDEVAAHRLRGAWLGPMLRGGVDGFVGRLVVGVHAEVGWAVLGTRARVAGELGPGAAGLWLGGGVSIGWRVLK